jgi:HEAT repeat protein/TolB-like protein
LYKKHRIRFLVFFVVAVLCALPGICHAEYASIAVLPLANDTGNPSLDWLSIGLQDAITIDVSYANGLNVIALPQYIAVVRKNLDELRSFTKHEAIWIGTMTKADLVWRGSFRKGKNSEISIELIGLDVRAGREMFVMSISAPTYKLLLAESALVIEVLDTIGFELTEGQRNMILSPKTGSIRAFELNAKGYEIQQRLSLARNRSAFYDEWVRLLRGAVAEDPGYAEAWVNLGWALYTSDDKNEALKAFSNALELKPFLIDANVGIGYVMRDYKKDYARAIEHMAKAVEVNPGLEWTNKELINTVVKAEDKSALPYILNLLDSERKSIRIAAIEALGRFKDASSLPELGKFISDSDEDIQYAAVNAIIAIGTEAAIPYLKDALDSSYGKRMIVGAILYISEEAGVPYLIAMLKDTSTEDCIFAAREIGRRRVVQAVPHLIEAIKEFEDLSVASMRALADIGDMSAMPALIKTLKDERVGVRTVAAAILGDYEAVDATPALWDMAKEDEDLFMRLRALISLALIGDGEAVSLLAEIVRGDDKEKASYVTIRILKRPDKFMGTELEFLFMKNDNA